MQLTMLGGCQEIGASCYLLEIEEKHILIDAGIRLGGQEEIENALPRVDLLERLDLILLTHAHSDHTGSLPIIYDFFPEVKIVCAVPTFPLMMLLFQDAMKLMEKDIFQGKGPLYDETVIDKLNRSIFTCRFGNWFQPFPDRDLKVCFEKAGHILGAGSVLIESREGKIMFTGDFCLEDQQTTKGLIKSSFQPDVVVTETTYGDKTHRPRAEEEEQLRTTVTQVLDRGGKVLIPTFALGRGQELILILKHNKHPIYVDGLVRSVCDIYEDLVQPRLFFDGNNLVVRVESYDQRAEIVAKDYHEPCCIIASSGMLVGGPSVFYAKHLLPGDGNAVLITSYQDEESPGKRVLEIADGIILDGEPVEVNCFRHQYDLSAHADRDDLAELINFYQPKAVVLVHGKKEAIEQFSSFLSQSYQGKIWQPKQGDKFNPLIK